MSLTKSNHLRLNFPQWQGGNNESYYFGQRMLTWLAPETKGTSVDVPVALPTAKPLDNENGIIGRAQINRQLTSATAIIREHAPDTIVTLGGDCLVSLAPFAYLIEKYAEKLGILWIDSHPDVMTPAQFTHSHAHVLGALMGHGDSDFVENVHRKLAPEKIFIAGIHDPLDYEAQFLADHNIATCSPAEVKRGGQSVLEWIEQAEIEYLAIHIDLDVLDPAMFRSVLFARPGRGLHDFGDAAEGTLTIAETINLVNMAVSKAGAVGLTIAEHLPWDAINLKKMLDALPLMK